MKHILSLIAILLLTSVWSQDFKGNVIDAQTKEPVPYASVYITSTEIGTITDSIGAFSFEASLPIQFEVLVRAQMHESVLINVSKGTSLTIELEPSHQDLEDVIVSAPGGGLGKESAFHVDRLDISELNAIQSSTLGEAIANINGVQAITTGTGISQPVIRGLSGLRVLTMINGVRTENQQWSSHHGMAINELGIGAVEVIKGPSSLLYGNDAFGGVLFLVDEPYARQNSQEIRVQSRFETVPMGTKNTAVYKLARKNLRFSAAGLYANHADFQMPDGRYLRDSRYNQIGGKFNLGISRKNWVGHVRYTYSTGRAGIPGHTHDSIPDPSSFISSVQNRSANIPAQIITNQLASFENKFFFNKSELNVILANTNNDLVEYDEKRTIPGISMNLNNTYLNVMNILNLEKNWDFITGVQSSYQFLRNGEKAEEMLLADYEQVDNGLYGLMTWEKDKWAVQFGARLDHRILSVSSESFERSFLAPNVSAGLSYNSGPNTIHFNLSTAYRAPHSSELLSYGIHHGALQYEIGDRNLNPERALQADFNYEYEGEHFAIVINPFMNYMQGFITVFRTDSIIDAYPVFEYDQIPESVLYGIDAGIHLHPHFAHWLHIESSVTYLRAHGLDNEPLPLMPQPRVNTFVRIDPEMKAKFKVQDIVLQHQYFLPQNEVAFNETSSTDYNLLNASVNCVWSFKDEIGLSFGVKNILNQRYINHLSQLKNIGMPSPGRNFYVSLTYNILSTLKNKSK